MADKINLKFCKFILGVNSKSSHIAVLSELGRFPIYFNIVLSMISYLHRLHHYSSIYWKKFFNVTRMCMKIIFKLGTPL